MTLPFLSQRQRAFAERAATERARREGDLARRLADNLEHQRLLVPMAPYFEGKRRDLEALFEEWLATEDDAVAHKIQGAARLLHREINMPAALREEQRAIEAELLALSRAAETDAA